MRRYVRLSLKYDMLCRNGFLRETVSVLPGLSAMKRKAQAIEEEHSPSNGSEDDTSVTSSGSESGTSGSDGSGSGSDSDPEQEVDVDFEFFDPQEIDFHGLRALLQTYLDGTAYNCSELVETVIKQVCRHNSHPGSFTELGTLQTSKSALISMQKTVGTVVKTQDSVDPIAVLTVLPLKRYSSLGCVKEVKIYLQSNTKLQANKQLLEQVHASPQLNSACKLKHACMPLHGHHSLKVLHSAYTHAAHCRHGVMPKLAYY